jgi:hypothetical protein
VLILDQSLTGKAAPPKRRTVLVNGPWHGAPQNLKIAKQRWRRDQTHEPLLTRQQVRLNTLLAYRGSAQTGQEFKERSFELEGVTDH